MKAPKKPPKSRNNNSFANPSSTREPKNRKEETERETERELSTHNQKSTTTRHTARIIPSLFHWNHDGMGRVRRHMCVSESQLFYSCFYDYTPLRLEIQKASLFAPAYPRTLQRAIMGPFFFLSLTQVIFSHSLFVTPSNTNMWNLSGVLEPGTDLIVPQTC